MAQLKRLSNKQSHCLSHIEMLSFLLISLVLLYTGVTGIIENKSPENLSSVWTTMAGFFTYFQYHLLILFGALTFTFGTWLFTNNNKC